MKMKILFVSQANPFGTRSFGGAESSMRFMAESLSRRGHRCVYLTAKVLEDQRAQAELNGINLYGVITARGKRYRIGRWLEYERWYASIKYLSWKHDIDITYCFNDLPVMENSLRAKGQSAKPKVILRMAGAGWYEKARHSKSPKDRYLSAYERVDRINYISEPLAETTLKKIYELDSSINLPSAFTSDIGSAAGIGREMSYPKTISEPMRIVMAARFAEREKRQDILIRAAQIVKKDLNVHFTFFGDGPRLEEARNLAKQLGVDDIIEFKKFKPQRELWKEFQAAHLLCHAADHEGLGKAIVEAMSVGLPVLASNVKSINEIIQEGDNGFLVENTPELWAKKILGISENPHILHHISSRGIEFARKNFDVHSNIEVIETAFSEALADDALGSKHA